VATLCFIILRNQPQYHRWLALLPGINNNIVVTKVSSSLGQYLAEPNGRALYTYGGDNAGMSNCNGSCILTWPAYQDKGQTTDLPTGFGVIKRTDNGETQYTYNGMPLYTFIGDVAGRVTGNGVSNFSLAKPSASTTNAPSASTPTTSTSSSNSSSSDSW